MSDEREIEAVARAMYETYDAAKRQSWEALKRDSPNAARRWMGQAEVAIAALDRVRDARSDEEAEEPGGVDG